MALLAGKIVHSLIPNLEIMKNYLDGLLQETSGEEAILFERATFLVVTSVTNEVGARNPYPDRHERLSNIIKTFKHSLE
jgi:Ras-related GTP-binding protein A/B